MKRLCAASILLVLLSVSYTVIFPLPVIGEKTIQNTNDIHQGDLLLSGNTNHTIIGETFHINGSIIITENATLYLRDATLNFTQTADFQFNIRLQDPLDGRPKLRVHNSNMTASGFAADIKVHDNGTAYLTDTKGARIWLTGYDDATLTISGTHLEWLSSEGTGVVLSVLDSTIGIVAAATGTVLVRETTAEIKVVSPSGVNSTIEGLEPGFVENWNYELNCSVTGTQYPDFTVEGSTIEGWSFRFDQSSNVTLDRSSINLMQIFHQTRFVSSDSFIANLQIRNNGLAELVNSSAAPISLANEGSVWIYWYLDVHVVDEIDQDVPMATVTAEFANGTQAGSAPTDDVGWARLVLLDWMQNTTAKYTQEPYRVTATYDVYFGEKTVEMNWNRELTIALPFMIPELSLTMLAVTAISVMGVAVLLLKRRLSSSA